MNLFSESDRESRAQGKIRLRMLLHHISWFLWRETLGWPVLAASRACRRHGWGLADWGAFLCLHPCTHFPHWQNYSFPTTSLFPPAEAGSLACPPSSTNWTLVLALDRCWGRFKVGSSHFFFAVISPYTSAYVSALPETPPLSRQQRLQLLLLALGGFAAIQTRLLICRTFRVDCFCLYFHNLNKGFISFKSVSQPKPSLIMQWQQRKYSVTQPY